MMEGEQLKRYVDSLERDINRRLEQGAVGRNSKIIASNNRVLDGYDKTINSADRATASRLREADAIEAVSKAKEREAFVEGKLARARTPKSIERWEKSREVAERKRKAAEGQLRAAEKARVTAEQAAAKSTRDFTAAQRSSTEAKRAAREADAAAAEELKKRIVVQKDATKALAHYSAGFNMNSTLLQRDMRTNKSLIESNARIQRGFESAADSVRDYGWEQQKLTRMMGDTKTSGAALEAQVYRTGKAYVSMERKVRDATASLRTQLAEEAKSATKSPFAKNSRNMPDIEGSLARNLGALTPLGTVTPGLLIPLAAGFVAVAQGVATAAQSLWLLPSALTAGAAGFGVMKMATMGVSDALSAMMDFNDPDKFAESLRLLSPAAQQFALSVQQLVPTFMELKNAVQDTFFAGLPQVVNGLAQTYRDAFGGMALGVSQFFNDMFTTIGSVLQDPRAQQSVAALFDGIVRSFQALMPMIGPFTQAFIQIASVGAQVLPNFTADISNLMIKFSEFVDNAASNGNLAKWMTEGWEAVKALGSVVAYTGKMIYEVFGLHGPGDIQRFKETLFGLIDGFGIFFATVEKMLNTIIKMFRTIADSRVGEILGAVIDKIGGIESLLAAGGLMLLAGKLAATFWKWGKLISDGASYLAEKFIPKIIAANTAAAASGGIADAGDFLAMGKGGKGGIRGAVSAMGDLITKMGTFATLAATVYMTWDQIISKIREAETPSSLQSQIPAVGDPGRDTYLNGGLTGSLAFPKKIGGMGPDPGEPGFDENWLRNVPADKRAAAMRAAQAAGVPFNPNPPMTSAQGAATPGGETVWGTGQRGNPLSVLGQAWSDIPLYPSGGLPVPTPNPGGGSKPNIPYGQYSLDSIPVGQFGAARWAPPDPRSLMSQLTPNQLSQKGYGYVVDPQGVFDAESRLNQQRAAVEEARARVLELAQDNQATEQQKIAAQNNIIEAERSYLKSQVELLEAQRGTWKKINESISEQTNMLEGLGAEIDADFGISKGLPGIAENLTKFLANLVAAPLYGALAGQRGAAGDTGGGKGLVGAAALSGSFGPQFMQPARTPATIPGATTTATVPGAVGTSSQPLAAGTSGQPLAAEAGFSGYAPGLNPRNVSTAGLQPQSMALLSLIQGMPQFAGIPLTSGYRTPGNKADQKPGGGMYPWHPSGRGLDLGLNANDPIQSKLGDQLNEFLNANKEAFGIYNTLWKVKDHFDHLHIALKEGPSPLMQNQALQGIVPPTAGQAGSTASFSGGSIPLPLPVTIVGGAAGSAGLPSAGAPGITPPPGTPGGAKPAAPAANATLPVPAAGKPGGAPGSTGSMKDGLVTKVWTVEPDGSVVWRSSYGNPTAPPKGQSGKPATTPPPLPAALPSPGQGGPIPWTLPPLAPAGGDAPPTPPPPPAAGGMPLAPGGYTPPGIGPSQIGAVVGPPEGTGSGFGGFSGGLLGAAQGAIGAAAGAAGMAGGGPGAGAALGALAQIGIEELNRAIAFAGQAAGIGVSGLMETFLPTGGSDLANNNWFTRLAGGVVGMRPLLPNFANISGAAENVQNNQNSNSNQQAGEAGSVNVTQNNYNQNGNSATSDLERLASKAAAAPMPAMGAGR